MQRVFITGANRGIGLEFVRQFLALGDLVFAGCRNPESATELHMLAKSYDGRLLILAQDLINQETIGTSYKFAKNTVDGIDILINNAGIFPSGDTLSNLNQKNLIHTFHVNAVGPIIVTKLFLNLLKSGLHPKIVNISSDAGSLKNKTEGGYYSYSISKAALNMFTRTLANDLRTEEIIVIAIHPGWVQTDMGSKNAKLTPSESVNGMVKLINKLTLNDTGKFYTYDGGEYPW